MLFVKNFLPIVPVKKANPAPRIRFDKPDYLGLEI
jgi:hypothetical protein